MNKKNIENSMNNKGDSYFPLVSSSYNRVGYFSFSACNMANPI